jgi:hypothetical protein
MRYQKKPMFVEALTFDEFLEHGRNQKGASVVDGTPWSFTFKGKPVTHERDDLYLLDGFVKVYSNDVVLVYEDGQVNAMNAVTFQRFWEPAPEAPPRNETGRGTGRTQRMLEKAVASKAPLVVVLGKDWRFARDLQRRVRDMQPTWASDGRTITRPDGGTLRFASYDDAPPTADQWRGLDDVEFHIDHAVRDDA